ncbi:MAG: copper chaperone PCu(A)C [Sulfitobacter sp.]
MKFTTVFAAGVAACILSTTALFAGEITIKDAYIRSSTPTSKTGAAFLMLKNGRDADDRLVAASSDVAKRVELHTHKDAGNGVMQMVEIEGGIAVPAGGMHLLQRGGDHIMFMGLTGPLVQGQEVTVILTFEKAGEVEVVIPVDHNRKADHGTMKHSNDS